MHGEQPDWVVLYGDTNSTAAGALTAAKLHFRTAHVEAGLRSFNRNMPEEVNRIVADHLSDLLFCPTAASMSNLQREGLGARALLCGDVMYDVLLASVGCAEKRSSSIAQHWEARSYALATVHRAENTDDPGRLKCLVGALERIAQEMCPVLLAAHPRTQKALEKSGIVVKHTTIIPPQPYLDMVLLEKRARMILTDSGGIQKEAYFLQVPCVTLREETEWTETLENSCNILAGASDPERIQAAARSTSSAGPWGSHFGRGDASRNIVTGLIDGGTANER